MKRIVLFLISIILVMSCLSGCIIIPRYRHFEIDSNIISSIEIYDLCENEDYSSRFLKTETPVSRERMSAARVLPDTSVKIAGS